MSEIVIHFEEGSNGTRLHIMISLHLNPRPDVAEWLGFTSHRQHSARVEGLHCYTCEGGSHYMPVDRH